LEKKNYMIKSIITKILLLLLLLLLSLYFFFYIFSNTSVMGRHLSYVNIKNIILPKSEIKLFILYKNVKHRKIIISFPTFWF